MISHFCALVLMGTSLFTAEDGKSKSIVLDKSNFLENARQIRFISIRQDGVMKLSPFVRSAPLKEIDLISSFALLDNTLFAGTNKGEIFEVSQTMQISREFETRQLVVTSMAVIDGSIYASTIAEGKVFRRSPEGKWSLFCELPSKYVWELLPYNDKLFAVCGLNAAAYIIEKDGKYYEFFSTVEVPSFISAYIKDNIVWIGSSEKGYLYRASMQVGGDFDMVAEVPSSDIADIDSDGKEVYIATNKTGNWNKQPEDIAPLLHKEDISSIWKVEGSKPIHVVSFPVYINVMKKRKEGVLVGLNGSGKLFNVYPDGKSELVTEVDAGAITGLKPVNGRILFTAGRRSMIGAVEERNADSGYYLSKVIDTGFISRWGNLKKKGAGEVLIQVRSGRVETPDRTWSDWSFPYASDMTELNLPDSRYIQFLVKFQGDGSYLEELEVSYRNINRNPVIESFDIKLVANGATNKLNFSWKASDPDGDQLIYRIYYRISGNKQWVPVGDHSKITQNELSVDKTDIPEGQLEFVLKVTDSADNYLQDALTAEKKVEFIVDNTGPRLTFKIDGLGISGRAEDNLSKITSLAYQVDGSEWVPFGPADSLLDSKREEFRFLIPSTGLSYGPHRIVIRAVDENNNSTLAGKVFKIME